MTFYWLLAERLGKRLQELPSLNMVASNVGNSTMMDMSSSSSCFSLTSANESATDLAQRGEDERPPCSVGMHSSLSWRHLLRLLCERWSSDLEAR